MSLFLLFRLKHVYNGPFTLVQERTYKQQGSIPVGCGPPAFVVTVRGGYGPGDGVGEYGPGGYGPWSGRGRYGPKGYGGEALPPPVDRMTDTCENITFPKLRWRAVKICI